MKDYIRYVLFSLLILLCKTLPGRFLYWIGLRIADLNYFILDIKGREAIKKNLRQILPDASDERIIYETRWVFRNFAKYLTEFFRFRTFDKSFFSRHVAIRGTEHIEAALAQGKGAVLLSAHLSNWELGAAAMSMNGYKVNIIAAMHRYGRVNNLFMREREHMGITVFDMESAPVKVMRALKNNELVCILGDRDPTEHGIFVNFFGKPCRFPQGPARFALATGAPIIPGFVLRRTNDSFTVNFMPPIEIPLEGNKDERVKAMTQAYAHVIENAIRWHPEEWGVFYDVWEGTWEQ